VLAKQPNRGVDNLLPQPGLLSLPKAHGLPIACNIRLGKASLLRYVPMTSSRSAPRGKWPPFGDSHSPHVGFVLFDSVTKTARAGQLQESL